MIPGLETLIFGALKAAIAKGAVAGAAHATPLALQHAAMHAAINVTGSAIAAGGAFQGAIEVGKAGKGVYDFTGKVEKYRKKHNIDANGQKMPTHLAAQSSSGGTLLDDIYKVVMMQIAAFEVALIEEHWDFDEAYQISRHVDSNGNKKRRTSEIQECSECPCDDFDLDVGKHPICKCGHSSSRHAPPSSRYFYLVAVQLASQVYDELRHCDARGNRKAFLAELRPCSNTPGGCPCVDFDQYDTGSENCMCGHGNRNHASVKGNYSHLYVGVMAEFLYAKLRNINPAKNPKKSLFLIHQCTRCDCKDFNRWYGNRLTDNHVCKCDHGYRSHHYLLGDH